MAQEAGLDLVIVAPNAQPPVARIIDYGRYKYTTEKQNREKKSKQQEVKGIKISPRIAEHDVQTALRKIISFLEDGHKVRVVCQFRAREVTRPENGRVRMDTIAERLKDYGIVERPPVMENRLMTMVIIPKPGLGKKDGKAKDAQNGSEEIQSDRIGEDNSTEVREQPSIPAQERSSEETA
jgi:translation initiation factor IF-3